MAITVRTMTFVVITLVLLTNIVFCILFLMSNFRTANIGIWGTQSYHTWLASAVQDNARQRELQTYLEGRAKEVDCRRLFRGEKKEMDKALLTERQSTQLHTSTSTSDIYRMANNCSHFRQSYGFVMDPLTDLERQFPIAFSVLTFKDAPQVVDLLRAVYRPQNFYCIHVDKKSPPDFHQALEGVSRCFPNVFLASRSINVQWGTYTILEPDIVCMGDLWRNKTWKYFINLTGQEFPLKTNYELVRILTAFKGANDIGVNVPTEGAATRWKKFIPAPHNITMFWGPIHIVASRAFVDYALHAPAARDFLQWCRPTAHASEHFFNSLNGNPHLGTPGIYLRKPTGSADFKNMTSSLVRYKNWVKDNKYPCPGKKVVRGICILNVLDLPMLSRRPELFANKFHAGYSWLTLRCLAEELHNRTRDQTLGKRSFNVTIYEQFTVGRQTKE